MSLAVVPASGCSAALGAIARFLLDGAVAARLGRRFPFGTLAVNLTGAFALGLLVGAALTATRLLLAGTGLLGAYTTFSTWVLETHRLGEDGQLRLGAPTSPSASRSACCAPGLGRELGAAL